jgi:hypothetical protein
MLGCSKAGKPETQKVSPQGSLFGDNSPDFFGQLVDVERFLNKAITATLHNFCSLTVDAVPAGQ